MSAAGQSDSALTAGPLVSIVIPCFNQAQFLSESVGSALAQTYPNIEIIVFDDGSTDPRSIAILDAFTAPRTRLIRQPNQGRAGVRNTAIAAARGTYVLPLDADDAIEPAYVAEAVARMESDPELGIVTCAVRFFGSRQEEWALPACSIENMLFENCIHIASLFRKADWEKTGGFDETITTIYEDYDFWLSILESGKTAIRLEQPMLRYRKHPAATTACLRAAQIGQARAERHATLAYIYQKHSALYRDHAALVAERIFTQLRPSPPRYMGFKKQKYKLEQTILRIARHIPGLERPAAKRLKTVRARLDRIALAEQWEQR